MTSLSQKISALDTKVDGLDSSTLQSQIDTNTNDISTLQSSKQNTLTAGDNITITGNTISSSGGTTDTTTLQAQVDTNTSDITTLQSSKQNTLTAGDNITIANNVISTANPIAMRVFYNDSNGVSVSGGNPLPYGTISFLNGLSYNLSTYKATILSAGKYFIGFSCYNISNTQGAVDIRLNGTIIKARFGEKFTAGCVIHGTTILDLVENDTISIVCDNGIVRVLNATSIPTFESSFFYMFKLT